MRTEPQIIVKFNHIEATKKKMMLESRAVIKKILDDLARDIKANGPYKEFLTTKVKITATGGFVEVNPWWIGFIEVGSTTHASRPFVEPASDRAFRTLTPKIKLVGDHL